MIWPAAPLLMFLWGVAGLSRELASAAAARAALIFATLTAPLLQHFRPGAIDHHNVQLTLLIWSLALAIPARARDGVLAGVCCALSVPAGPQMYPPLPAAPP